MIEQLVNWLQSRTFYVVLVIFTAICFARGNNAENMWYGRPTRGEYIYVHQLSRIIPDMARASFAAALLFFAVSFVVDGVSKILIRQIVHRLVAVGIVLAIAGFSDIGSTAQKTTTRLADNQHVYLLAGTSGGSGNMFYRVFACDRREIICRTLSNDLITLFLEERPTLQFDATRQHLIVSEEGRTYGRIPVFP